LALKGQKFTGEGHDDTKVTYSEMHLLVRAFRSEVRSPSV